VTIVASERISILGAGGHSKVVIGTAEAAGYQIAGVFDDRAELWGQTVLGYRIEGPVGAATANGYRAVTAVGSNAARRDLAERVGVRWVSLVHPSAQVHRSVSIDAGTVVFAGVVLQPDTVIGRHVIINTAATVDHDCEIGDLSHVAPGAHLAGSVRIGEGALIGVGAAVMPGMSVGTWSVVGAGAAVVTGIPDGSTWAGVPAKPLPS
jgi:sugar O-acyltransferase (sialic acid O-acetyltransferase NeuD family)